jgi:hypothetical protein
VGSKYWEYLIAAPLELGSREGLIQTFPSNMDGKKDQWSAQVEGLIFEASWDI